MRFINSLIFLILSIFIVFSGCREPFFNNLPGSPEYWQIRPMGTPLYVFLDDNYNVSALETDKTAIYIDGNPLAEGVTVLAETYSEEYDDAVRIINNNTNTIISMFFHKGQRFPWMLSILKDEQKITAYFSGYEWNYQRFSITFDEGGELLNVDNIRLSSAILLGYEYDLALSEDNNIRIKNIYAALGIYESISRLFPSANIITANITNNNSLISEIFSDKNLSAFTVTATLANPAINEADYYTGNMPSNFIINNIISVIVNIILENAIASSPPAAPEPLKVSITDKDGKPVDSDTVYYLEHEEEIIFNFEFSNFTNNTNVNSSLYDPFINIYLPVLSGNMNYPVYGYWNGALYSFTNANDNSPLGKFTEQYSIKIKRNSYNGYFNDGAVSLIIFFGQNAIVNGSSEGIMFQEPGANEKKINNSIFELKFTVKKEEQED